MRLAVLRKTLRLTAIIFMVLVLLQMLVGHELNNGSLLEVLAISFGASLLKVLFFPGVVFGLSLLNQFLYFVVVGLLLLGGNLLFEWNLSPTAQLINILSIFPVYLCVRFVSYQQEKVVVKEMNERLQESRQRNSR